MTANLGEAAKPCHGDTEYNTLLDNLKEHYNPKTPVEELLVKRIALLDWRLDRTALAERKSMHLDPTQEYFIPPAGAMERILKYERTMDRELKSTIAMLGEIQQNSGRTKKHTEKQGDEAGFERETSSEEYENDKMILSVDPNFLSTDKEISATDTDFLSILFGTAARARVLRLLTLNRADLFFIREIARQTSLSPQTVQYEVNILAKAGLVIKYIRGRQTYCRINEECPAVPDLRSLLTKYLRVED